MKQRVLIIEDESILRKNLCQYLAQRGFEVQGAATAQEVYPVLRAGRFEILLLDLALPDCDGLTLLEQVRTWHPHLPVVIMTAQKNPELENRAYQLGARAYLEKPITLATMKDTLLAIAKNVDKGEIESVDARERDAKRNGLFA